MCALNANILFDFVCFLRQFVWPYVSHAHVLIQYFCLHELSDLCFLFRLCNFDYSIIVILIYFDVLQVTLH